MRESNSRRAIVRIRVSCSAAACVNRSYSPSMSLSCSLSRGESWIGLASGCCGPRPGPLGGCAGTGVGDVVPGWAAATGPSSSEPSVNAAASRRDVEVWWRRVIACLPSAAVALSGRTVGVGVGAGVPPPGATRVLGAALVGAPGRRPGRRQRGGRRRPPGSPRSSSRMSLNSSWSCLSSRWRDRLRRFEIVVRVFLLRPQHVDRADVGPDDHVVELGLDVLEALAPSDGAADRARLELVRGELRLVGLDAGALLGDRDLRLGERLIDEVIDPLLGLMRARSRSATPGRRAAVSLLERPRSRLALANPASSRCSASCAARSWRRGVAGARRPSRRRRRRGHARARARAGLARARLSIAYASAAIADSSVSTAACCSAGSARRPHPFPGPSGAAGRRVDVLADRDRDRLRRVELRADLGRAGIDLRRTSSAISASTSAAVASRTRRRGELLRELAAGRRGLRELAGAVDQPELLLGEIVADRDQLVLDLADPRPPARRAPDRRWSGRSPRARPRAARSWPRPRSGSPGSCRGRSGWRPRAGPRAPRAGTAPPPRASARPPGTRSPAARRAARGTRPDRRSVDHLRERQVRRDDTRRGSPRTPSPPCRTRRSGSGCVGIERCPRSAPARSICALRMRRLPSRMRTVGVFFEVGSDSASSSSARSALSNCLPFT